MLAYLFKIEQTAIPARLYSWFSCLAGASYFVFIINHLSFLCFTKMDTS